MSDLPDIVHQATLDTIERVRREEQERIIKELKANEHIWRERIVLNGLIALIKKETNA